MSTIRTRKKPQICDECIYLSVEFFCGSRSVGSSATVGTHKNVQMGTAPFYFPTYSIVRTVKLYSHYSTTSNPAILDSYYVSLYLSSEGKFLTGRECDRGEDGSFLCRRVEGEHVRLARLATCKGQLKKVGVHPVYPANVVQIGGLGRLGLIYSELVVMMD